MAAVMAVLATTTSRAADAPPAGWLTGETPEQHDSRMAWWREAKFGFFIHWGIYSIPADGEWHMRVHQQSFADYSKYAGQFNPVKFNADQWMALAHEAGMKYVVITAKHHDGFAMYGSKVSAYNIVEATPFKRDVVKEIAEACPRHDVRFGEYYSYLSDWGHPGGGAGCPHWDKAAQDGDIHDYLKNLALPQLRELLSNYGPVSEIWLDSDGARGIKPEESAQILDLFRAHLKQQPNMIVRGETVAGVNGDFTTFESHMPPFSPQGDWELCSHVSGAWGYTHAPARPLNELLPYLVTAWGMGGNVLLNIGPTPDGSLPDDAVQRLREIGAWMKTYGESIYGTTAGPFTYLPWGTATRKGDTIYLHIFKWPADGKLKVPLNNDVKTAAMLAPGGIEPLKTHREHGHLLVELPSKAPDSVVNVIRLDLVGDPRTDYASVLLNKAVKASSGEKTVTNRCGWRCEQPTGWLEIDTGRPVTVDTLRVSPAFCIIKNSTLEYKSGNEWKPILSGMELKGDIVVKEFPPATAQVFRLNIIEADKIPAIRDLELYPSL